MATNKINAETMQKAYDENGENIMTKKYSVGDTVLVKSQIVEFDDSAEFRDVLVSISGDEFYISSKDIHSVIEKTVEKQSHYQELEEGFYWGNIIKYILRWQNKNVLEDLKKARQYIDWLIELEEL